MKTIIPNLELENAQANLLKLLTHPVRLAILQLLRDGEECVCHMEAILGYRQSYLSQQLSVLREGGVIEDRRDGWNIFYHVTKPEVFGLLDIVSSLVGGSDLQEKHYTKNDQCPCPKCNTKQVNTQNEALVIVERIK